MKAKILFQWISLIVLVSLVFTACGTPSPSVEPTQAPEQPPAQPVGEKTKVVIFVGMGTGTDPAQITAQDELAKKYNASQDKIEIEFMYVTANVSERYLSMVSSGNAPQLVGPIGISSVAEFYDTWADTTPLIQADNYDMSDFYGPSVELTQYPDRNVGLPIGLYPSFLFYNKDSFDAAGIPYLTHDYNDKSWTMEKLREYAIQLTLDENDNNPTSADFNPDKVKQWGYDDSWVDMRGLLTMWDAATKGRPVTDDYKTATANSPEWIYGLQWVSDAIWKDYFMPNQSNLSAIDAAGADPFGGGYIAMAYRHTWFMAEWLNELPFKYDIAPLPYNNKGTRVARIHADIFAIPEKAANKEAAWEVMKWLSAPEQIMELCNIYGCLPSRKSVQGQYTEILAKRYPGLDYSVIYNAIDYLDSPQHESYVPQWAKVAEVLNNGKSLIFSGENKDAKSVLDDANVQIQKLLDEYWTNK